MHKACRFCHLTQTNQTDFVESSLAEMLEQTGDVMGHYSQAVSSGAQKPAKKIHFNWMARGEPLASSVVLLEWPSLVCGLTKMADDHGIEDMRFNLSTIFPSDFSGEIEFKGRQPTLYYSLYSMEPEFRKRWLPKALPPEDALGRLARWQQRTQGEIVLHWAFIEGENETEVQCAKVLEAVARHGIKARFNLVRYNPYSPGQGVEPSEMVLQNRLEQIRPMMTQDGSKIVPRVGFDVKASCGMFVQA